MPEISIIIPNYNTEKYLPRCLESLIQQSFSDIEIIVIDDGSTDSSIRIIQDYLKQDKRIKLIQQQNFGPAEARNKGLKQASGKYIMFCDSDDWYEKNMCEIMHNTIEKQKVDLVCCHNFFEYEDNLDVQEKQYRTVEKYYNPKKSGKFTLSDHIILSTNVLLWNKIWRADLIKEFQINFPLGHEHEDDAFWYMYSLVGKNIFFLKKKLYHYFLRSGSIMSTQTHNKPKNRMDRFEVANYVLNFYNKNSFSDRRELMALIYLQELKCSRKFFSLNEAKNICFQANQNLNSVFKSSIPFICVSDKIFLLSQKKSIRRLVLERIYYSICFSFWFLFSEKKKIKFLNRIQKNKAYFKKRRIKDA